MLNSRRVRPLALGLTALLGAMAPQAVQAEILTAAKQAIIVDYDSGEILFCKDCQEAMPPSSMSKLMTVELLFQRLKDGRLKPEDTFHVSETAWRQGQKDNESKMWVALNSDVSVRRAKGPTRPLLPETERAEVALALQAVDAAVLFDEDTPRELIAQVLPDVLIKGADWSHFIAGKEEVEAAGGKVMTVALEPGYSTTNIVERVLGQP